MQVDVLNTKGEKTGRVVELPDEIFNIEPNDHCIYLAVKQYMAAQHLGLHSTKTRAEVKGSSRKLHRQKGTGGSRKGNIRNPLYKGGGIVNGPKPHSYDFKLNRKVKELAKLSALSYKARENKIVVVEDINFETPKTSEFVSILNQLKGDNRKSLFVLPDFDPNFYLSARNVRGTDVTVLHEINTYEVVDANVLIMTEGAVRLLTMEAEEVVAEA